MDDGPWFDWLALIVGFTIGFCVGLAVAAVAAYWIAKVLTQDV